MGYAEALRKNLPIGSGIVESAGRHIVHQRLKQSGMRWSPQGAQAVLNLRTRHRNGQFEQYWENLAAGRTTRPGPPSLPSRFEPSCSRPAAISPGAATSSEAGAPTWRAPNGTTPGGGFPCQWRSKRVPRWRRHSGSQIDCVPAFSQRRQGQAFSALTRDLDPAARPKMRGPKGAIWAARVAPF
jgi:hypothetical protein